MFGWRRRIGYITPTVMEMVPYDFYRIIPEGVVLVGVTCNISGWVADEYDKALGMVNRAAEYLASRRVDCIIHGGAPLVITKGEDFEQKLIERVQLQTGKPLITVLRAAIKALNYLGAQRIVLASPYPDELNLTTVKYLEAQGFVVTKVASMHVGFNDLQDIQPGAIYRFVGEQLVSAKEAEAVYIPCPQWPVAQVVDVIERDFGKPVVASTPAVLWASLSMLGVHERIKGYGKLLECY